MAAKKKKAAAASVSPEQFIAKLPEPQRSEIARLHAMITKTVPKLEARVSGSMLGYGPFHYRYPTGREGDAFKISLAVRARYISLYALAADDRGYVAERYKERLSKASIGKSCVRFKSIDDLDAAALKSLLRETAKTTYGTSEV